MGLRGLENGVTRFHQVRVPAANRIGPEGAGLKIALTTLNTGRLSLPAMCVGAGKWCLKIAREWSAAREQWGKPVAQHEAVGAKISFIAATTFALEAVLDLSSQMADEDRNDIRIEAALAKLYGSEMAWLMADELVQIRGGRGFETADVARRPRRAGGPRRADAARPAHQPHLRGLHRDHAPADRPRGRRRPPVGRGRPHRPRQVPRRTRRRRAPRPAASTPAGCPSWSPAPASSRARTASSTARPPDLSPHLRYVERTARKLARSTFYAMSRWQGRMETKQGFLGRIVDIGAELFAMSAACVRAEHAAQPTGDHGREAYQLADVFCRQSRIRVDELFGRLWTNTDDLDRKVVKGVLGGSYDVAGGGHRRPVAAKARGSPTPPPGPPRGTTSTAPSADAGSPSAAPHPAVRRCGGVRVSAHHAAGRGTVRNGRGCGHNGG